MNRIKYLLLNEKQYVCDKIYNLSSFKFADVVDGYDFEDYLHNNCDNCTVEKIKNGIFKVVNIESKQVQYYIEFVAITFAQFLTIYRINNNLTVKELANLIGVPQRTCESWLSGGRIPDKFKQKCVFNQLNIK